MIDCLCVDTYKARCKRIKSDDLERRIQLYNRILAIRKEKSRDAARSRRGKENYEFYELAKVLLSSCYHQKYTFVIMLSQKGTFVVMLSPKRQFCHQIYHLQGTVIAFVIKDIIFKVYLLLSYSMFFCRHPQGTFVIIVIIVEVLLSYYILSSMLTLPRYFFCLPHA